MSIPRKARRCPICGRPNLCGEPDPALPQGGCWCFWKYFPRELLARVPSRNRRSPCICPDCLAEALAQSREDGSSDAASAA